MRREKEESFSLACTKRRKKKKNIPRHCSFSRPRSLLVVVVSRVDETSLTDLAYISAGREWMIQFIYTRFYRKGGLCLSVRFPE